MSNPQPIYTPPQASVLSEYVFFPIYDRLVTYYPRTWRPNAITLFGIACTTLSSILMLWATRAPSRGYFDAGATLVPQWSAAAAPLTLAMDTYRLGAAFLVFCGTLNLMYCVADNTDGRQARRTRQSSHVGEYLDHGLDCCTSLVSTYLVAILLGLEAQVGASTVLFLSLTTLLCHTIHLEENVFLWGNRWVSVDEAMVLFGVGPMIAAMAPLLGHVGVFGIRVVAVLFTVYIVAQSQLTFSMIARRWSRLGNPSTLLVLANAVVFVLLSYGPWGVRGIGEMGGGGAGAAAEWVVGAAISASIVIHETIAARCMKRPAARLLFPCLALPIVWGLFAAGAPVAGAIAALALHVCQIVRRCRDITRVKSMKP